MNNTTASKNMPIRQFLTIVAVLQFTLYLTVYFDIAVAREIFGCFYLTFIPGYVILKLLKMDKLDTTEKILFSVGLSIAFLMFIGLFLNEIGPLFGILAPLETASMTISIGVGVLIGAVVCYLKSMRDTHSNVESIRIHPRALIFIVLPVLSIIGVFWANTTGSSSLLLVMILAVATVFVVAILAEKFIPPKYYAIVIFSIALALLLHSSLISNYVHGNDIHIEYYTFKMTQDSAYWTTIASSANIGYGRYSDMLSVTILPTIYSNILNIDGTWLFKVIFPLILSLVPVVLFKLWQIRWDKKVALISTLLLMSQITFYTEVVVLVRQMIAELFFVLLLFVLFSKRLDSGSSKFCFIVFSIALIVSHYSLALIFLFFIFGTWLLTLLVKKKVEKDQMFQVVSFAVFMFSWYIFTSSASSFQSILQFSGYVYQQLGNFFNPASRGTEVMIGLGMEAAQSNWQLLSRMFAYATQFFIVIGFALLLVRRKKMKIDWDYFLALSLGIVLLAMTILLPGFAGTLQMTRFYHITLLLIAPFFVLGCETCFNFLRKKRILQKTQIYASILMTIILVAYLMFQTNFVYEVVGDRSWSLPLSKNRMDKTLLFDWAGYVDEQSVLSSQWLSRNVEVNNTEVYATGPSWVLLSYGEIYLARLYSWTNTTTIAKDGVLYLGPTWNYSESSSQLDFMDRIYSNGEAEVWSNSANVTSP
jgi:uncharacterized membrane protein